MFASGFFVVLLFARTDDKTDLFNTGSNGFVGDQLKRCFCDALLVDKILQRKRFLFWCASRNHGPKNAHQSNPR